MHPRLCCVCSLLSPRLEVFTNSPPHPHTPLFVTTSKGGPYFDFDLILSNRRHTHQNTPPTSRTHTHPPHPHTHPHVTDYPTMDCPNTIQPVLNIFVWYLRSLWHALQDITVHIPKSLFAGTYQCTPHSLQVFTNAPPYPIHTPTCKNR